MPTTAEIAEASIQEMFLGLGDEECGLLVSVTASPHLKKPYAGLRPVYPEQGSKVDPLACLYKQELK